VNFSRIIAAGVLSATLSQVASAAPFMNITFDGDAEGSAPSTAAPVDPVLKPWAIGGYTAAGGETPDIPPTAASGTILVNDVGGMNNAAVLTTNSANGEQGALWVDTAFGQTSQQMTLSFDVNVIDAPTNATAQPKTLNGGPGTAGIFLGMNTYTTNDWAARFAIAPTSAGGGVFAIRSPDNNDLQSFFTYTEGDTHNVKLVSNYNTGKVSTYVDDIFKGEYSFWDTGATDVSTSEFFFHLNGELGNANSVAIDNIVAAVPEPTGIALLGLGAGVLLMRRRHRRQHSV
jgi:hypothetical protein